MKDWIGEVIIALGVGKALLVGVGTALGAAMAILASTSTFNGCVDQRVIRAVEPRITPIVDMVEFSIKKQGHWEEYLNHLRQRDCDDRVKRGLTPCKGGRMERRE